MLTRTFAVVMLVGLAGLLAPLGTAEVAEPASASLVICDLEEDPVGGTKCTAEHYQRCVEQLVNQGACRL